jgi:S1-C subfamily serine protease
MPSVSVTPPVLTHGSFVAEAVRAVGPAVVRIDIERTVPGRALVLPPGLEGMLEDPELRRFFGGGAGSGAPGQKDLGSLVERGLGSGFITSADGVIVTNAHVVKNASKIVVTLTDGRTFDGVVSGTDDLVDLAVVKINPRSPTSSSISSSGPGSYGGGLGSALGGASGGGNAAADAAHRKLQDKPLPVAMLGSSANVSVGDWAIAVGNPHGLNNSVTLGVVSSLSRSSAEVGLPEKRMSLIQTSAPLNAGNSGGVIANDRGEVIAVATAVRAHAEGIGFAIPIDRVKDIVSQLASGNPIPHAYVGIRMLTTNPHFARQNNADPNAPAMIPEVEGALVMHVVPRSPAAHPLGLRRFDVIVAVDGSQVRDAADVQALVEAAGVGKQISVHVMRGGEKKPILVSISTGDMATSIKAAAGESATPSSPLAPSSPFVDPRM